MKKLGIAEKVGESVKNEKTQQGSARNFEEIGSKETIKSFPTPQIQSLDHVNSKGKKLSIEKKLIKGMFFFLINN